MKVSLKSTKQEIPGVDTYPEAVGRGSSGREAVNHAVLGIVDGIGQVDFPCAGVDTGVIIGPVATADMRQ